ncbi:MAG: NfeD family protein [bacterium]|nr:NfeD family protein [bacterium]
MRKVKTSFILLLLFLTLICPYRQFLHAEDGDVYIIPVHGIIDLGLASFVKRSVQEAEKANAKAVILDIKTYGGRVDAAVDIKDALSNLKMLTIAYVNPRAISAGALIALSCKHIIVAPGSMIGAASPVKIGFAGMSQEKTGEKEISFVRSAFRAAAEQNNHSTELAEAMVDQDIEVKKIIKKGKLLTLTGSEAVKIGLAKNEAKSIKEILRLFNLDKFSIKKTRTNWAEHVVRFLTHPIVSSLLLTLGFLGLLFEIKTPGWGVGGTISVIFLALFFWGHYIVGLANIMDIVLFIIGVVLLFTELFITPGFGFVGSGGLFCILAGIYLALVKQPIPKFSWEFNLLNNALYTISGAILASGTVFALLLKYLPKNKGLWSQLALSASEKQKNGFNASSTEMHTLVGKRGVAHTNLRPAGKAMIDDKLWSVMTDGDFIEEGAEIVVEKVEGNRILVKTWRQAD